jgi:hypothetical protein
MKAAIVILFASCVLSLAQTNTDANGYVTNVALLTPFTLTNSAGDVITNAVLYKLTVNKFIYKTDGGMGMMSLATLPQNLLDQISYDPEAAAKADADEAAKKERDRQNLIAQQQQMANDQTALANATQAAASNTQSVSSGIRDYAEKKWPTDYEMQEYEIKQQTEAYNWLAENPSYSGVAQDVYNQIKSDAATKWGVQYDMQEYEIKQQAEAYLRLH